MQDSLLTARELLPNFTEAEGEHPPVSLQLPPQGICCLLGRRAGIREAYLKMLSGLDLPAAGELELLGLSGEKRLAEGRHLLGRQLGYVARQAPLLSVLNGQENAIMPAVYHGAARHQALQDLQQLLVELGFSGDLQQLPAYMTPLEKMQLALARAALLQPQLLVLEDPWHSLERPDFALLENCLGQWGQRLSLLVATAHLGFVRQYAEQLVFIGETQSYSFTSWQALVTSGIAEIQDYLESYRSALDWKV